MLKQFRSRQEARAVAKKLSHRFPANDYEAWPDGRGYWVLVVRYRDEHGHSRFKFVAPEAPLGNTNSTSEKSVRAGEAVIARLC
jgi:hypothetical protein